MRNHYSQRAVASIVIPVVFTALSTVMFILRVVGKHILRNEGRRIKRKSLSLDDYVIFASLCFVYSLMGLIVVSVINLGGGRHIQDISHDTLVRLLKHLAAIQFAWSVSVGLVKLGILLFYLQIFTVKKDRRATYIMMGVAMCWMLSAVVGAFFQCRPFSYIWNTSQDGNCDARVRFWVAIGISHIVIDILILLLPVRMVWYLQVPRTRKLGVCILLGLGSSICLISGFRLRALDDVASTDISYNVLIPHIWSMLEPTIAICTACLPVTRPVFRRIWPSSASKQPSGRPFNPKIPASYSSVEEATAGRFERLTEHEVPLKEMARSQVIADKESGDDLETPPSKPGVERELEGIRVLSDPQLDHLAAKRARSPIQRDDEKLGDR